jgi:hypothetical protein
MAVKKNRKVSAKRYKKTIRRRVKSRTNTFRKSRRQNGGSAYPTGIQKEKDVVITDNTVNAAKLIAGTRYIIEPKSKTDMTQLIGTFVQKSPETTTNCIFSNVSVYFNQAGNTDWNLDTYKYKGSVTDVNTGDTVDGIYFAFNENDFDFFDIVQQYDVTKYGNDNKMKTSLP